MALINNPTGPGTIFRPTTIAKSARGLGDFLENRTSVPVVGPNGFQMAPISKASAALGGAPGSGSGGPEIAAQQLVRNKSLADAFDTQLGNINSVGQSALDSARSFGDRTSAVAGEAFDRARTSTDTSRFRDSVTNAAGQRQNALELTVANLKNQAEQGYNASLRKLDSERAASGLTGQSTELQRNLGDSYYRNYLPVEAQTLALQQQEIAANLQAEQALQGFEMSAGSQFGNAASQYLSSLAAPIGLQLGAVSQLGGAYNNLGALGDKAFFHYVQGDDQLPAVPVGGFNYNVPNTNDPLASYQYAAQQANQGQNLGQSYQRGLATGPNTQPAQYGANRLAGTDVGRAPGYMTPGPVSQFISTRQKPGQTHALSVRPDNFYSDLNADQQAEYWGLYNRNNNPPGFKEDHYNPGIGPAASLDDVQKHWDAMRIQNNSRYE